MQSPMSDTADPSQPMMLCDPRGHPRASVSHLEVAGKISCAPHGLGHFPDPAARWPAHSHTLVTFIYYSYILNRKKLA